MGFLFLKKYLGKRFTECVRYDIIRKSDTTMGKFDVNFKFNGRYGSEVIKGMAKKVIVRRYKKCTNITIPDPPAIRVYKPRDRVYQIDFRGIKEPNKDMSKVTRVSHAAQLWTGPEDLQKKVDEYFLSCFGPVLDKYGRLVLDEDGVPIKVQKRPFTMSGLAYSLGISRGLLLNYRKGLVDEVGFSVDEVKLYSHILDRAKQRVEIYLEEQLMNKDSSFGSKFNLDVNFGWVSSKERAEIAEKEINMRIKEQELLDENNDNSITINVVRKRAADDDEL